MAVENHYLELQATRLNQRVKELEGAIRHHRNLLSNQPRSAADQALWSQAQPADHS